MTTLASTWQVFFIGLALVLILAENALGATGLSLFLSDGDSDGGGDGGGD
jgi:hypothetical protein